MTESFGDVDTALSALRIQLELQEIAYRAALAATSRVLPPSLLDFLR
jgi:flagellar hook-associated protein 3 FlgL